MDATSGFRLVLFETSARGSANICKPIQMIFGGRGPSPLGKKAPPPETGTERRRQLITFVSAIVRARSGPLTGAQWVDVLRAHAAVHTADGRGVERALRELYVLGGSGLRQRMLQEALFVEVNKVNDSTETVQELLTMRACPNATDESGVQLPNLNATVDEFARAVHAIDFPEHSVGMVRPYAHCGSVARSASRRDQGLYFWILLELYTPVYILYIYLVPTDMRPVRPGNLSISTREQT
eukprot:GEMP01049413.1.p1 GENE.GEMP01049413.1~~GEMP01049413.1.p1  ORF type:complete len:239 (+),score=39.23 GEMP01049413.1:539-1255(+)